MSDLHDQTEPVGIFRELARTCWAKAHETGEPWAKASAECAAEHIPPPETMAAWTADGATEAARAEAAERLTALVPPDWHDARDRERGAVIGPTHLLGEPAPAGLIRAVPDLVDLAEAKRYMLVTGLTRPSMATVDAPSLDLYGRLVTDAHRRWTGGPHPLAPLVADWQRRPVVRVHESRRDRRIMPALTVIGPTPERERGLVFGGLVDDRPSAELSLFPELEPHRYRVPLLEIVDRTGLPIRSRGRGAPLEGRLLVRGGLLMIRPADRALDTVRIAVTVGELLDGLWPLSATRQRPRDAENWPKLLAALYRARDWTVPDADGGRWFPMALRRLPPHAGTLPERDGLVVLDLAPVPGAQHGPSVDLPWLDRMGVTSGPAWRAYIAGRSLVWQPGTTRRPVPGTAGKRNKRYGWSRNPDDFPVLTLADLCRLAFGDDTKHRTCAGVLAPWLNLPDLTLTKAVDKRTGVHGWRLMPTDRGDG